MSSSSNLKSDVDKLDDLVKDLLDEVNRPIDNNNTIHRYSYQRYSNNDSINPKLSSSSASNSPKHYDFDSSSNTPQRSKTTREERIRIKRGTGSTEIPITTTTTKTTKPQISSSVDEHLIDSLLESVQNTLKKRAEKYQSNRTTDIPIYNRRTYSSSAAYPDSIHRVDPIRNRFPIKLYRTDSSTSTLSSRRPYSRQDIRDGYGSASTNVTPTYVRATSEPPPDGPIELRRMNLICSPSRTCIDSHLPNEYYHYSRSTVPSSGIRVRSHDYSGYETDTGLMTSHVYPPRYYHVPPPPMYPYYRQYEQYRPIYRRPDGYDTDSGLVSSGRLHMTRPLPSRMAVIPETVIVNNRMVNRSRNLTGYETDSGMNTRQYHSGYRQIPVDIQHGTNEWLRNQSMAKTTSQQQRFVNNNATYRQMQDPLRNISIPVVSHRSDEQEKRTPNSNVNNQTGQTSATSSTFPLINQSYNANVQTRVENSSFPSQDEGSRRSSVSSTTESDLNRQGTYQAHNVSRFWYKGKMSREDAINLLKTKPPGTFLIRDSQGFPGSFGLAVKVETLPSGIQSKPGADPNAELVRHYLIERTPSGHVRLKGCSNEPDFANLSALVYQHTLTALALPIKLILPTVDIAQDFHSTTEQQSETKKMSIKDLLDKGAACNVIYLNNVDVESLSGQMAVAKALRSTFDNAERLQATIVNFKVSNTGITLTDTKKKLFSRRHFPKEYVTYCGVDYEKDRFWTYQYNDLEMLPRAKCFGFVSKKINGTKSSQPENECHIFAEIDPSQPSTAIVNFVSKVMIGSVPV